MIKTEDRGLNDDKDKENLGIKTKVQINQRSGSNDIVDETAQVRSVCSCDIPTRSERRQGGQVVQRILEVLEHPSSASFQ